MIKKPISVSVTSLFGQVSFVFVVAILFMGCTSPRAGRELSNIPLGSQYAPSNLYAVSVLPDYIRRVAVLPVYLPRGTEVDDQEIDGVVQAELRRIGRFEIVEVSPDVVFSITGSRRLSALSAVPESLIEYMKTRLKADGILQTDLTSYRPYRPFEVGIRSRLYDLSTRSPLWAVDEVMNAGDKEVHVGSRRYSLDEIYNKYPFEDSYSALRSPNRFAAFAVHTLFNTIPGFELDPPPSL